MALAGKQPSNASGYMTNNRGRVAERQEAFEPCSTPQLKICISQEVFERYRASRPTEAQDGCTPFSIFEAGNTFRQWSTVAAAAIHNQHKILACKTSTAAQPAATRRTIHAFQGSTAASRLAVPPSNSNPSCLISPSLASFAPKR